MSAENLLILKVQVFYEKFKAGAYSHPSDLAMALEELANSAWDEVDELYQPSLFP